MRERQPGDPAVAATIGFLRGQLRTERGTKTALSRVNRKALRSSVLVFARPRSQPSTSSCSASMRRALLRAGRTVGVVAVAFTAGGVSALTLQPLAALGALVLAAAQEPGEQVEVALGTAAMVAICLDAHESNKTRRNRKPLSLANTSVSLYQVPPCRWNGFLQDIHLR